MPIHVDKKIFLVISLILLGLGALGFYKIDLHQETDFISETFNFVKEKAYWSERIESIGPKQAYEELKGAYSNKDITTQHLVTHIFGDLLYKQLGMEGVTICDYSSAFGCYHGVIEAYVASGGNLVIILPEICIASPGTTNLTRVTRASCFHAVGHGVADISGFQIKKSLEFCDLIIGEFGKRNCGAGVFMEYYSHSRNLTTADNSTLEWRKFDPQNPYAPCPSVPEEYERACYSQLGFWWNKVLAQDYKKIGDLCNAINDKTNREICFFWVGALAAILNAYDSEETIAKCDNMPNNEGKLLCRSGAHFSFQSSNETRSRAEIICRGLEEEDRCLKSELAWLY